MKRFEGKVAMLQGGAMGRAIALGFAAEGASLCIADLDAGGAEAIAAAVRETGSKALAAEVDARDYGAVEAFVEQAKGEFGRIDVLVNTVGWNRQQPFLTNDRDFIDRILEINLRASIYFCRAVAPLMMAAGQGRIVNISSDAGRVGSTGDVVYSAAKAGILGLTKALARELAAQRINVNCVCPGPTNSPLLQQSAAEQPKLLDALTRAIPWKRVAEPADIAAAVHFLASDQAEYITGQTLSVSGGLTMI